MYLFHLNDLPISVWNPPYVYCVCFNLLKVWFLITYLIRYFVISCGRNGTNPHRKTDRFSSHGDSYKRRLCGRKSHWKAFAEVLLIIDWEQSVLKRIYFVITFLVCFRKCFVNILAWWVPYTFVSQERCTLSSTDQRILATKWKSWFSPSWNVCITFSLTQ